VDDGALRRRIATAGSELITRSFDWDAAVARSSVYFEIAEGVGRVVVAAGLELGREAAQLQLDFAQPRGQPIALVSQRPRQRDHGLDQTPLAVLELPMGGGRISIGG